MEEFLKEVTTYVALAVEAGAVLVIGYGALEAICHLVGNTLAKRVQHRDRKDVWRRFGVWLLLGLEFALAADILRTIISPTWNDIGQLAAIAAIRTFLNYFLEKDVEKVAEAGMAPER